MIKIFSGIRPSGKLHLGNYLGAIKQWVKLQDEADQVIFSIADYHGITTPFDPKTYHAQTTNTALDFLAAGVNPKKALLVRQSRVTQHTELAWLFNSITPVSWLDRLPTYREKLEQASKYQHVGLLDYPVLMAADILAEKSNLVPVGEDQLPHIDLTNEIAKKFNSMFGEVFEPVKPYLAPSARIMSLKEPTKKMSKTGDDGIALSDSPDEIRRKIKGAATDSGKEIRFDEDKKSAISNLLTIFSEVSGKTVAQLEKDFIGSSYTNFKSELAEAIVRFLEPFQKRHREFASDPGLVEKILEESELKTRHLADETLKEVKMKMGF